MRPDERVLAASTIDARKRTRWSYYSLSAPLAMEVLVLAANHGTLLDELREVVLRTILASGLQLEIVDSLNGVPECPLADSQLFCRRQQRCSSRINDFLREDDDSDQLEASDEATEADTARSVPPAANNEPSEADATAQLLKRMHKRDRKIKTLTAEAEGLKAQLAEALARAKFVENEQEQFFEDVQSMKDAYDKLHSSHQKLLWEYLPSKDADTNKIPRLSRHFTESETGIGPYTLGEVLGYGQYAVVYASETPDEHHEPLAIKAIDKGKLMDLVTLHRINSEIASLRDPALQHPSILSLRDVIHTKRHIYLVTDRGGKDLFEYFGPHDDGIPEETIKNLIRRVALAVQTLHRHNYCHRDLKPENILYAPNHPIAEHTVKLVDFGLCTKATSSQDNMLHDFCGSPGFFAPELLLQDGYDGRKADVWSLGCIILELILGNDRFATMWMVMYELNTLKDHPKFAQLVKQSMEKVHSFCHSSEWTYSSPLRSLLLGLLCETPTERLTVDQLLNHQWLDGPGTAMTSTLQPLTPDARSPSRAKLTLPSPASFSETSPATDRDHELLADRRPVTSDSEPCYSSPHVSALPFAGSSPSIMASLPRDSETQSSATSPSKAAGSAKVCLPSISPEKPSTSRSPDKTFAKRNASHTSTYMPAGAPHITHSNSNSSSHNGSSSNIRGGG